MNVSDEQTNETLYKNSIRYLHKLNNTAASLSVPLLNSYYATKFEIIQQFSRFKVPAKATEPKCPRCCIAFRSNPGTTHIKPEVKKSKFARKLLNKTKQNKVLTRYQAKYLKRLHSDSHNTLVTECFYCKKNISQLLVKPKLQITPEVDLTTPKKKKNKKKQNKLCGLDPQAVLSVQNKSTPQRNNNNTNVQPIKNQSAQKSVVSNVRNKSKKKNAGDQPTKNKKNKKNIPEKVGQKNTPKKVRQKNTPKKVRQKKLKNLANIMQQGTNGRKSGNKLAQFLQAVNK